MIELEAATCTMCFISKPALQNVVAHFKVRENSGLKNLQECRENLEKFIDRKKGRNFYLVSILRYSFTVFPHKGHVNITGLPRYYNIKPAVIFFCELFNLRAKIILKTVTVSNRTYCGLISCLNDDNQEPLAELLHLYASDKQVPIVPKKLEFRAAVFPSIVLKVEDKGTVTIFNSGSYVIVGLDKRDQVLKLYKQLCVIMRHCWKTGTPETRCVQCAV